MLEPILHEKALLKYQKKNNDIVRALDVKYSLKLALESIYTSLPEQIQSDNWITRIIPSSKKYFNSKKNPIRKEIKEAIYELFIEIDVDREIKNIDLPKESKQLLGIGRAVINAFKKLPGPNFIVPIITNLNREYDNPQLEEVKKTAADFYWEIGTGAMKLTINQLF